MALRRGDNKIIVYFIHICDRPVTTCPERVKEAGHGKGIWMDSTFFTSNFCILFIVFFLLMLLTNRKSGE